MANSGTQFHINQRLSFNGSLATVRYIGEVTGTKGEWLGVEWDDSSRGKHGGDHDGTRYFDCLSGLPTAASFIRTNKKADQAKTFLEALRSRYSASEIDSSSNRPIKWGGKVVEEIGFDKIRQQQSRLEDLRVVMLEYLCVSGVRSPASPLSLEAELEQISQTCPRIIDLGLSFNLLEDWFLVLLICRQLPRLKSLRISGNRFASRSFFELGPETQVNVLPSIQDVVLDETLMSWIEVERATQYFPNLLSLSASLNLLHTIPSCSLPRTITKLTLDRNSIESLDSLSPLEDLPALETLQLRQNRISVISRSTSPFVLSTSIKSIDLSRNNINDWGFINSLSGAVPSLTNLGISPNPLFSGQKTGSVSGLSAEDAFLLTVARLQGLQMLNYSQIRQADRQNAELHYLSSIARTLSQEPLHMESQILSEHPRWAELCQVYGTPAINRHGAADLNRRSLGAQLIELDVCLTKGVATSPDVEGSCTKILVPRFWDIYKIKAHLGRKLGFLGMQSRLILKTSIWEPQKGGGILNAYAQWEYEDNVAVEESIGKWVTGEEELVDSMNPLSFWIDGKQGTVRIEPRDGFD
ncbi:MAG: hypothetical protein M1814_003655 [Vezdaea aestivalis]|nr:MAG: hypothetical protein M1814_003655 [Vezdaea aestivalis]